MRKSLTVFSILLFLFISFPSFAYTPKAQKVVGNVYAIIGPLGQRDKKNDGLNSNIGFIITGKGVILIDSGASKLGAQRIEAAIRKITRKPVRWVINTGSQDHRWLGNHYFSGRGAKIIALKRTAETQKLYASQQLNSLKRFLGARLKGTVALPATTSLSGDNVSLKLGGETLVLRYTDAHYPGDSWVWLPKHKLIFTGDLVFVDRLLGVLPWSSVRNGHKAFKAMEKLKPVYIVPGHGQVCGLKKARKDTGDYYNFLVNVIGKAAINMDDMGDVINRYTFLPQFEHLKHYENLHRANMNRAFLEFEKM